MTTIIMLQLIALLTVSALAKGFEPETRADIGEVVSNTSSFLEQTAAFYCEIIGGQTLGQDLKFSRYNNTSGTWKTISQDYTVDASVTDKYTVTDKYRLNILGVQWSDEGLYKCVFEDKDYAGSLLVIDPPTSASIYWSGGKNVTEKDTATNLTCEAGRSRPPASISWLRGGVDVTNSSVAADGGVDEDGYGASKSLLALVLSAADEGATFTCHVDLPGFPAYVTRHITVVFSGASHVTCSLALILVKMVFHVVHVAA